MSQRQCVEVIRRCQGGCEVRPLPTHGCAQCASGGGCQGGWFARLFLARRGVFLPFDASPGQRLTLSIPENELARLTRNGYGLLLAGLLVGAFCGWLAGAFFGPLFQDLATALVAVGGLSLALLQCRRLRPADLSIEFALPTQQRALAAGRSQAG